MLKNTLYRLRHDKKLRIAYFGGSITQGAGSSDASKYSYRALTTEYFKNKYPDAEITEIYAAIGGTGTSYGMFRCEYDVLSHDPDLVFIEFAANDNGDDYERVLEQTKTIFRKILTHNPYADAIILFSSTKEIMEYVEKGVEFISRSAQTAAAHIYGIPTIDHGSAFHAHIRSSGRPITDFIPDELHPSDEGYRIIADCILGRLDKMLSGDAPEALTEKAIPSESNRYDGAYIADPARLKGFSSDGFVLKDTLQGERFDKYLSASKAGSSFSFDFEGDALGFTWVSSFFNADVTVYIDGEAYQAPSWDNADRSFHRFDLALFAKSLPRGKHHVKVEVPHTYPCDSGELVGISGILICK